MGSLFRVKTNLHRLHWLVAARTVEISFARLYRKAGFNPDQPRDKFGRWTNEGGARADGGASSSEEPGISDSRVLSDATSDDDQKPEAQYAQNPSRGNPNGARAQPNGTPAQETLLATLQLQVDQTIARVQEIDGNWRPTPSLSNPDSIEGAIAAERGALAEAQSRLDELRTGIGGNLGPPLDPLLGPSPTISSSRPFDGPALIDAYRAANNMPDLFGNPTWPSDEGTVAASEINGSVMLGINSGAPGYTNVDRLAAENMRDTLIDKYPDVLKTDNIGWAPNDSLFHAESTTLLRAAAQNGGTLANQTIEVHVDRPVCPGSCLKVLPYLGLELGNPIVTFIDRSGLRRTMWNGRWFN